MSAFAALAIAVMGLLFADNASAGGKVQWNDGETIPSGSSTGGSVVGHKFGPLCWTAEDPPAFVAFDPNLHEFPQVSLSCTQEGAGGEVGDCSGGIYAIKDNQLTVIIAKGNKNNNGTISRSDKGWTAKQGSDPGWPDAETLADANVNTDPDDDFFFIIAGGKGKLDGTYKAIGYQDFITEEGVTIVDGTLVVEGPLGSGGTDTVAMAPTAASFTFDAPSRSCARLFNDALTGCEDGAPCYDGIAIWSGGTFDSTEFDPGFFDGSLLCSVDNDVWVTPCEVRVLVTQAHGGTILMDPDKNNFPQCDGEAICGQAYGPPDAPITSKGWQKKNLPETADTCLGCVLFGKYKGSDALSDVVVRLFVTALAANPQNLAFDFRGLITPTTLTGVTVTAETTINPGGSEEGKMQVKVDNTDSADTQGLLIDSVVAVIRNDDGDAFVEVRTDLTGPTPSGNSTVWRWFTKNFVDCYAAVNNLNFVPGSTPIPFTVRGLFPDATGQAGNSGITGDATTKTSNSGYTAEPGACVGEIFVATPPTVQMATASSSVGEADVAHTVDVQLNTAAALQTAVTVNVVDVTSGLGSATLNTDYTYNSPQTVIFAAGSVDGATQTVTVTILDDDEFESGETVNLQLQDADGATILVGNEDHVVTIIDNE
jgi:hypothetical protein